MGVNTICLFYKAAGFEENLVPNKTHPGGPKRIFGLKEVPVFVIPTPTVSITSKILVGILKRLDNLDISPFKKL